VFLETLSGNEAAMRAATVTEGFPGIKSGTSFSGFTTVNKDKKAHMFFWMIEAQDGNKDAATVLWCRAGPGARRCWA